MKTQPHVCVEQTAVHKQVFLRTISAFEAGRQGFADLAPPANTVAAWYLDTTEEQVCKRYSHSTIGELAETFHQHTTD